MLGVLHCSCRVTTDRTVSADLLDKWRIQICAFRTVIGFAGWTNLRSRFSIVLFFVCAGFSVVSLSELVFGMLMF